MLRGLRLVHFGTSRYAPITERVHSRWHFVALVGDKVAGSSITPLYLFDQVQTMPGVVSIILNGALACVAGFLLYAFVVFAQRRCVFNRTQTRTNPPDKAVGMMAEMRLLSPMYACCMLRAAPIKENVQACLPCVGYLAFAKPLVNAALPLVSSTGGASEHSLALSPSQWSAIYGTQR